MLRGAVRGAVLLLCLGASGPAETTLQFIYIGGAACGFCKQPGFIEGLERARLGASEEAAARGWRFESVCVSVDSDLDVGREFVDEYCTTFDRRIARGLGFRTPEYDKYVKQLPTRTGLTVDDDGVPWVVIAVTTETEAKVHSRLVGTALTWWLKEGAPMGFE